MRYTDMTMRQRYGDWIVLAIIIAVSFIIRMKVLDIPFERDEGEYAYAAQLMLSGVPPFQEAYNMKFPGIYAVYAVALFIFGQTHRGVHLALAFVNAGTIALMYLIGKRLFDRSTGLIAAACFAMLSFLPSVHGIIANSEHFVLLFALAGILLAMKALDEGGRKDLFLGGVLLGVGCTIKQNSGALVLFTGSVIVLSNLGNGPGVRKAARQGAILAAGVATPLIIMGVALYFAGVFDKFWFWTFAYAREYISIVPLEAGFRTFKSEGWKILLSAPLVWAVCFAGLASPIWDRRLRWRPFLFLMALLAFSALPVVSGLYFRPHYFIFILPPSALLFGAAVRSFDTFIKGRGRAVGKAAFVAAVALFFLYSQRAALSSTPEALSRELYGYNPFPESIVIADHIAANTAPEDKIAVLGSEPQIFFYSRRRSATGYIYTYPLMERQRFARQMQQGMMEEIRRSDPAYVVFVDVKISWGANPGSVLDIFDWLKSFVGKGYELEGMVDLLAPPEHRYRWGDDILNAPAPESGYGIYIYKKAGA